MANLVSGGMDGFNATVLGLPHPSTLDFIQRQLHQATDSLTAAGRQFMEGAHALYERFSGEHAMRLMRAAARAATHIWQPNMIHYLADVGALQQAPVIMQRWIMAEPTIRRMYHDQRCDGYSHSYVDVHPGQVKDEHYDYRRIMSGVVVDTEDGGWRSRTWAEDLLPDDAELSIQEKSDILDTHWALRQILKVGGDDPTSRFNAELG